MSKTVNGAYDNPESQMTIVARDPLTHTHFINVRIECTREYDETTYASLASLPQTFVDLPVDEDEGL